MAMFSEPFRRLPSAQCFRLAQLTITITNIYFEIANGTTVTIAQSSEFSPFANDLSRFYGANAGNKVKVTRIS
ncbi:hypothetical protein ACOBV9_22980 (plasmid) [Pseudoalteromonas espejiana]